MKFAFIDAEKAVYGVRFLCSIFAVSPSGFYVWKKREPSKRQRDDEDVVTIGVHESGTPVGGVSGAAVEKALTLTVHLPDENERRAHWRD